MPNVRSDKAHVPLVTAAPSWATIPVTEVARTAGPTWYASCGE
jgi:hypothetical protein